MDYNNKKILAPMVRVCTLPFRLLALDYGADIVYTEEIIDHKVITCDRVVNDVLGTVDLVEKGSNSVVFRTRPEEKEKVVFQIGTADPVRALQAAELICSDVAAIDINMGCPRPFSLTGGMGAALLSKPELIHDILTTLRRNLNVPVTGKIRLHKSREATLDLARMIEKTGVSALAVHGRKVSDRPRHPAQWEEIAAVASALAIPVIANGDVLKYADFDQIKQATGAASVMAARGAMWNASIFRPEGPADWEDVKREFVKKAALWDCDVKFVKHTLREMIIHHSCAEWAEGKSLYACANTQDLCDMYGVRDFYDEVTAKRAIREALLSGQVGSHGWRPSAVKLHPPGLFHGQPAHNGYEDAFGALSLLEEPAIPL